MRKLRRTKTAQYFYHVTPRSLGKSYTFKPKDIMGCDYREPDIKRVCVAPTISGCFAAIHTGYGNYNVYRTKRKVKAYITYNVADVGVTREKWLLSPTEFIKVGTISSYFTDNFPQSTRGDEESLDCQKIEKDEIAEEIRYAVKSKEIVFSRKVSI